MQALPQYITPQQRQLMAQVKTALQEALSTLQLPKVQHEDWLQNIEHAYTLQLAQYYFSLQMQRWQKRVHKKMHLYSLNSHTLVAQR